MGLQSRPFDIKSPIIITKEKQMKKLTSSLWPSFAVGGVVIGLFVLFITLTQYGPRIACGLALAWICIGFIAACLCKRHEGTLGMLGYAVLTLSILGLYLAFTLARVDNHNLPQVPEMQAWHIYLPSVESGELT